MLKRTFLIIILCSLLCGCTSNCTIPLYQKSVGLEFLDSVYHRDKWMNNIDQLFKNGDYLEVLKIVQDKNIENTDLGIAYLVAAEIGLWVSEYYDESLNNYLEHMMHNIYVPDRFHKVEYLSEDGKYLLNRNLIYVLERYTDKTLDSNQVDVLLDTLYRLKVNCGLRYLDYNDYLILKIGRKNNDKQAVMWNEEIWRVKNDKENSTFNFFK